MNDLPSVVRTCSIESYVDDTKVYLSFSSKDIDTCLANITEDLRLIASWCCSNHLLINPSKTKLIVFGTRQLLSRAPDIKVPFLGQELVPVPAVKDLGIILDSNLTFNNHVNSLTSSLISTLCQISRIRHLFSEPVLLTILNALVFSKLLYCSTVWAGTFQQAHRNCNSYKISLRAYLQEQKSLIISRPYCINWGGSLSRIVLLIQLLLS